MRYRFSVTAAKVKKYGKSFSASPFAFIDMKYARFFNASVLEHEIMEEAPKGNA